MENPPPASGCSVVDTVPGCLVAQLKQAGLTLDVETSNLEVLKWLRDIANVRCRQTTPVAPAERWRQEIDALQPCAPIAIVRALPLADGCPPQGFAPEQLQHPLSLYDNLLQGGCSWPCKVNVSAACVTCWG